MLVVIAILLLACVLRFYGYEHRWGLAYDQSHDALVAREALYQHKLPLLGPFSSAGAFVTGPQWYWFIMLGTLIYPRAVITPWIILTLLSIFFVCLMMIIGKHVEGEFFSICIGLLAAVSTGEIAQSTNLTNQGPLALLSALSIFAIIKYFQTKNFWYLCIDGLVVSIGINTHLQGVLLMPLFILPFFFQKPSIKGMICSVICFVLPFIPLIIFDSTHHFYNIRNMWQYYRHDQYKISLDQLGRNWRNYLGIFWPRSLAEIIGGNIIFSYIYIILFFITLFVCVYKQKISKVLLIILLAFFISFLFMRYLRTPLFDSYLMFLHPWIFLFVAWTISFIFLKNNVAGMLILTLLVSGSLVKDIKEISITSDLTAKKATKWENTLNKRFPNQKFAVYDYRYKYTSQSVPFSLFLDADEKINDHGIKLGIIVVASKSSQFNFPVLSGEIGDFQVYNLSSSSSAQLQKSEWIFINPSAIYHNTEEWYMDKQL